MHMEINVCMKQNKNSKIKSRNKIINIIMAWNHAKAKNSFFPRTARIWNSLPIECFPLTII